MASLFSSSIGDRFLSQNVVIFTCLNFILLPATIWSIAVRDVDIVTEVSLAFVLVSVVLSLGYSCVLNVLVHGEQISRRVRTLPLCQRSSAACLRISGLMTLCWVSTAGLGLMVASRQPICLKNNSGAAVWQKGYTCRLHRAIVALSVLMLIATCSLCYLLEKKARNQRQSMLAIKAVTRSATSSETSCVLQSPAQSYQMSPDRMSRVEVEQLLNRRNSVSSQRAIYPHKPRFITQSPSKRAKSSPVRLQSLIETCELNQLESAVECRPSSRWTTSSSNVESGPTCSPHSSLLTGYTGSPHSSVPLERCMRMNHNQARQASEDSDTVEIVPQQRCQSPPPPSWCPTTLRQAPLSSDPAIRALSSGTWLDGRLSMSRYTPNITNASTDTAVSPPNGLKRSCTAPNCRTTCANQSLTKSSTWTYLTHPPQHPQPTVLMPAPLTLSNRAGPELLTTFPIDPPPRAAGHIYRGSSVRLLRRPSPIRNRSRRAYRQYVPVSQGQFGLTPSSSVPGSVE